MPDYRIYSLSKSERILAAFQAECADDDAAVEYCRTALADHPSLEIWQGTRMVGNVTPEGVVLRAMGSSAV